MTKKKKKIEENYYFFFEAIASLEPKKMFIKKPTSRKDELKVN